MTRFSLKIVTPDGLAFDGQAEEVIVRTIQGDMGVLANHINCVVPLGMGRAMILADGNRRYAACIGGMLSVVNGAVTLVPTTFEWKEDINVERANAAYESAQAVLKSKDSSETDLRLAEAKVRRALVRKGVASI